jgi:hypothetical protein
MAEKEIITEGVNLIGGHKMIIFQDGENFYPICHPYPIY